MNGIESIAEERSRQVLTEGFDEDHDDLHISGELSEAAACYALAALYCIQEWNPQKVVERLSFPFDNYWWKPSSDPVRNLEKAGALIAAEIDRIRRTREKQAK